MQRMQLAALTGMVLSLAGGASGQTVQLPQPDQDGWIKLFRGNNVSDFYARLDGSINTDSPLPNNTFKVKGDTIITTGKPTGHLAFKQIFSHYHFKMEMMLPRQTNCGLLLHIRENEPKLLGTFPRSLECQGDPAQGVGELWTISDVYCNVKVNSSSDKTYNPSGQEVTHGAGSRVVHQHPSVQFKGFRQWNTIEVIVHGSDSVTHIVNGVVAMHYTKVRIANNMSQLLNNGRIAVQSEGDSAFYRNLQIRLLPGDPLYTPTGTNPSVISLKPNQPRNVLIMNEGELKLRDLSGGARYFDANGRKYLFQVPVTSSRAPLKN